MTPSIDKVNKPFLPVAAGALSQKTAWLACVASGAAGVALMRACFSALLFRLYCAGTLAGALGCCDEGSMNGTNDSSHTYSQSARNLAL